MQTEEHQVEGGAKALLDRAVKSKISDIHIEPLPNLVTVRYRHAGQLYVASKLPKASGELLAVHFKRLANLDENISDAPQAGSCEMRFGRRNFTVQVSTMPVLDGEKITLHLTEQAVKLPGLDDLGLWGESLNATKRTMAQTSGLILVADRQGSNIGLTIGTLLQTIERAKLKTAYIGSDVFMPANVEKFSSGGAVTDGRRFKMLEKQNYEAIGIELFTEETATIAAIEFAATKKLVLAGTVAASTAEAVHSLKHSGQNHSLAANLRLALGQTFVRKLCERCHEAYEPSHFEHKQLDELFQTDSAAAIKRLNALEQTAAGHFGASSLSSSENAIHRLWRAKIGGCRYCDRTGHSGVIGIFEACEPSDALRAAIAAGRSALTLQELAAKDGMLSLETDALVKTLLGLIDLPTLLSIRMPAR